jgi:S-adenosylmethionine/arginine decarboxylase-like enzyme
MFGKSYLLDMYNCKIGTCDDLELHYRFLEELVYRLGMTPMSQPLIIHAPVSFANKTEYVIGDIWRTTDEIVRVEKFPEKAGVSAWQPLIESGIQIHSLEPTHFSSLDVYTCGQLNPDVVREFAREKFGFISCEEHLIDRGINYNDRK